MPLSAAITLALDGIARRFAINQNEWRTQLLNQFEKLKQSRFLHREGNSAQPNNNEPAMRSAARAAVEHDRVEIPEEALP